MLDKYLAVICRGIHKLHPPAVGNKELLGVASTNYTCFVLGDNLQLADKCPNLRWRWRQPGFRLPKIKKNLQSLAASLLIAIIVAFKCKYG